MVNVAALALSMPRFRVHEISNGASGLVHGTDLRTTPGEPPHLLQSAWIVQASYPGEMLFGSTCCVGYYPLDGAIYIVGLDWPDGAAVARWVPQWGEREIDVPVDMSPLLEGVDRGAHREWAIAAARYGIVLALLMEAEDTPIHVMSRRPSRKHRRHMIQDDGASGGAGNIVYISLPRQQVIVDHRHQHQGGSLSPGMVEIDVHVRGHLKRQPCGPDRADRRWVWIESYEARRWAAAAVRVRIQRA
jgi:hypothetical protein